jgi:hypothetical protein
MKGKGFDVWLLSILRKNVRGERVKEQRDQKNRLMLRNAWLFTINNLVGFILCR